MSSKKAAHVFQVRLESGSSGPSTQADPPRGPAKQAVALITLRASTHAAKQAWVEQLQAAVSGSSGGGAKASTAAPAATAAAVPAALAALGRSSSSASEDAAPATAAGVPRKISTAIFPSASEDTERPASCSSSPTADPQAAAAESVGDGAEGEGPTAAEEALVAAIAAQAALRQPTPQEAAVLACVVEAAASYVEAARTRLAGLTQRIVSASMLQGTQEQLRQGLLAVLLPPGATAARLVGFNDAL